MFIRRDGVDATVHANYFDEPLDIRAFGPISVEGIAAHDAVATGSPVQLGGVAETTVPTAVADADAVRAYFDEFGRLVIAVGTGGGSTEQFATLHAVNADGIAQATPTALATFSTVWLWGGDNTLSRLGSIGVTTPDSAKRAAAVGLYGGDATLRASAASGGTSTSTAVDNLGWVKSFLASLDVTVIPTGGTPTLDVWIQTQTALGTWTDILHFAQVTTTLSETPAAWTGPAGGASGTQGEGAAVTVDNFFAIEAKSIAASTVRLIPLGDSLRVAWTEALGGGTGGYTFSVTATLHA